ncbi:rhomboid family intramembrane serine protease [Reichenbachiella versicolor]|uniref:rhomboid family intramembrane serine protease n=1 Tax=Reichenbachiella versicolor TaxID=1821036 RepID=UPI000D6E06CE|nr:rhomboid family intramembrane serine protease [Reichenbachiella versicolor]
MSLTVILIIVTVVVSYSAFKNPSLAHRLVMNPVAVRQGQWYRMLTSGFVHGSWAHLGFNMFTFYFFGSNVEYIFQFTQGSLGAIYFVAFYLMAIVVSDLITVFKQSNNPGYNSLGASGGVSAIVFCSIMFFPTDNICLYGFICLPGFILGGIYIVYSYMKSDSLSDNINHDAHLYGAIFGLIFSVLVDPEVLSRFVDEISVWRPFAGF